MSKEKKKTETNISGSVSPRSTKGRLKKDHDPRSESLYGTLPSSASKFETMTESSSFSTLNRNDTAELKDRLKNSKHKRGFSLGNNLYLTLPSKKKEIKEGKSQEKPLSSQSSQRQVHKNKSTYFAKTTNPNPTVLKVDTKLDEHVDKKTEAYLKKIQPEDGTVELKRSPSYSSGSYEYSEKEVVITKKKILKPSQSKTSKRKVVLVPKKKLVTAKTATTNTPIHRGKSASPAKIPFPRSKVVMPLSGRDLNLNVPKVAKKEGNDEIKNKISDEGKALIIAGEEMAEMNEDDRKALIEHPIYQKMSIGLKQKLLQGFRFSDLSNEEKSELKSPRMFDVLKTNDRRQAINSLKLDKIIMKNEVDQTMVAQNFDSLSKDLQQKLISLSAFQAVPLLTKMKIIKGCEFESFLPEERRSIIRLPEYANVSPQVKKKLMSGSFKDLNSKDQALFKNSPVVLSSFSPESKRQLLSQLGLNESLEESEQKTFQTNHHSSLPASIQKKLNGSQGVKNLPSEIKSKLISALQFDDFTIQEKAQVLSLSSFSKVPSDTYNSLIHGIPYASLKNANSFPSSLPFDKLSALDKEQILDDFGITDFFFDDEKEIIFSKDLFSSFPSDLQNKLKTYGTLSSVSHEGCEMIINGGEFSQLNKDDRRKLLEHPSFQRFSDSLKHRLLSGVSFSGLAPDEKVELGSSKLSELLPPSDVDLTFTLLSTQLFNDFDQTTFSPLPDKSLDSSSQVIDPLLKTDPTNPYLQPNFQSSPPIKIDPKSIPKHLSTFFQTHRIVFDWEALLSSSGRPSVQKRSLNPGHEAINVFYVASPKAGFWFDWNNVTRCQKDSVTKQNPHQTARQQQPRFRNPRFRFDWTPFLTRINQRK